MVDYYGKGSKREGSILHEGSIALVLLLSNEKGQKVDGEGMENLYTFAFARWSYIRGIAPQVARVPSRKKHRRKLYLDLIQCHKAH
jgi:hypothetical protein